MHYGLRPIPRPHAFNVITDCSDPSEDEEQPSSAATLLDLQRRDRASVYAGDSDPESGSDPEISRVVNGRARALGVRISRAIVSEGRREVPSRIEIMDDGEGSDDGKMDPNMMDSARGAMKREHLQSETRVIAPHARFFIEKERSCVSINFEPAV